MLNKVLSFTVIHEIIGLSDNRQNITLDEIGKQSLEQNETKGDIL